MTIQSAPVEAPVQPPIPLQRLDHLELWVGNAKQAAYYYQHAFGFRPVAYRGPETGCREAASYLLEAGKIRIVLTTGLTPDHPACVHVQRHGDGVRDVALAVDDAREAFRLATERGAHPVAEPRELEGGMVVGSVGTYGDTIHSFIQRQDGTEPFLPGFRPWSTASALQAPEPGLLAIDHVVGNVGWDEMNAWVGFYQRVFGFHPFISFDDKDISTEFSALRSVVVADPGERIKFPLNEPAEGRKRSQIEEYLQAYGGPGVQHLALSTGDIVATVKALRARGVEFLATPASYYAELASRVGDIQEDLAVLQEQSILVDRDDRGYMLQIFTRPLEDRPTFFIEIIQRRGGQSFGKGNFKALFEAIEREQAARGNL